ncbi:molybdopterin molybdenumtransferase [Tissierella creatinophila DSM 6911]|uniref:Molybdopterin molybdenumtransferase n=2 Tax=Tissierella creatinophila TaxID=79681 RepID=A0A1U7M941_TISCR|nr:molybdopterin molybdenumtransferase [Tissierella creatinophila DSM 6911]
MMKRNIYIDNMDVDLAKDTYFNKLNINPTFEYVKVENSIDRISFDMVEALMSSPNYNAAAMDGIAVVSAKTLNASEVNPVILEEKKDFYYINTGNVIKEPFDAVIMIEDCIELPDGKVQIIKSSYPWQHIRQIGEDIVKSEMIIPSNHKIRPIDIGALLSGGVESIKVFKKPKVGILPTGTEIVDDLKNLKMGNIIDSNSRVFQGEVLKLGGDPFRYSPIEDDYELLKTNILKMVRENDIMLINAGSSAGSKDYTVNIIKELGETIVHGIAMKPGKPTILGIIEGKPVIGLPGYPVSSYLVFEEFVKPLIHKFLGKKEKRENLIKATIAKRIVSSLKNRELIRVNLGEVGDKLIATPLSSGAGVTMSLVKADGIGIIPQNVEGAEAGEEIDVKLLKPLEEIKETVVSIGSHDLIMDILGDMTLLSSGHVGSMGGIMAMRRGECHIAPIHLLYEKTGEYNISYIKKYFKGKEMSLIKGVKRLQGFMIKKEDKELVKTFRDLLKEEISFVNRQRGAGTRVLLDYHLKLEGIDPQSINGYNRELNTHMAVASAVKDGKKTVGLGIYSAAKAMDLDFVEVTYEDYDFLVETSMLEDEKIKSFIRALSSKAFETRVLSLGGYKLIDAGEIIHIES